MVTWQQLDFDRVWTLAVSGHLKFAHMYFTKPHYNSRLRWALAAIVPLDRGALPGGVKALVPEAYRLVAVEMHMHEPCRISSRSWIA